LLFQKVKVQDLPAAVQQTVKEQTRNATLIGLAKEVENGKTVYELETKVNGRGRDLMIDSSGGVLSVAAARQFALRIVNDCDDPVLEQPGYKELGFFNSHGIWWRHCPLAGVAREDSDGFLW